MMMPGATRLALLALPIALACAFDGFATPAERASRLVILSTAAMLGGLESAGVCCHSSGGLARRAVFYNEVRATEPAVLVVDAGDFVEAESASRGDGLAISRMMAATMSRLQYDAWTPGEMELGYGMDHLIALIDLLDGRAVSANVVDETGRPFLSPWTIQSIGGLAVGVTGITDPNLLNDLNGTGSRRAAADFRLLDAGVALHNSVQEMVGKVDLVVVLAHVPAELARELASIVPGIDVMICGHRPRYASPPEAVNGVPLVMAGDSGLYHYQFVLDLDPMGHPSGFAGSGTVVGHPGAMGVEDKIDRFIESDVKAFLVGRNEARRQAIRDRSQATAEAATSRFLGADICARCHQDIHRSWSAGGHAGAFGSLARVGRETDNACLRCHVTGAAELALSNFLNPHSTAVTDDYPGGRAGRPPFPGVQCEACHGRGTSHGTPGMIGRVSESTCRECHDETNDPDFDFGRAIANGSHHR